MNSSRCLAVLIAAAMLTIPICIPAQVTAPPPPTPEAPAGAPPLPQDLLDSLLAPIALYPDQLLTQILMASTYPLEVVEAARFVKANPNLKGPALDDALKDKTWDASVLSLAAFPQILDMMSDKLEWTQRLGDAFLDDEGAVMRTVQALRWKAQQAGNLQDSEQQKVVVQERVIYIQPAQPQYVYVPVYDPVVIYGPWWAPAYRPWFWYPPPIWGYPPYRGTVAVGVYWGRGWVVTSNNWGWCQPNWSSGSIHININNNNIWVNRPAYATHYKSGGNWNHNVEHRRGVAYRDTVTGDKYRPTNNAGVKTRESYRGRDNATPPANGGGGNAARPGGGQGGNTARPSTGAVGNTERPGGGQGGNMARPSTGAVGNTERPAAGQGGNTARPSTGAVGNTERPGGGLGGNTARPSTGAVGNTERPATGQGGNMARPSTGAVGNAERPAAGSAGNRATPPSGAAASRPSAPGTRPAPAYQPESRPQVQRDAQRGAQSRAAMQRPAASGNRGGAAGGQKRGS
jgi:hypothetical protein